MRAFLYSIVIAAVVILSGLGYTSLPAAPMPSAVVKVLVGEGHGSGVHIGNGYIVTAAHVTNGAEAKLRLDDGTEIVAETLWENKAYDIALLRVDAKLASAPLSCRTAAVGEKITAHGNQTILEFVSSDGKVAGSARQFGPWLSVLPVDMTIVGGMSGGPSLDERGRVIGINVGVLVADVYGYSSLTGFGAIVPSSVVCALMGRT